MELVHDHGPLGKTGHTGSDGSTFAKRIGRFAEVGRSILGENASYGKSKA